MRRRVVPFLGISALLGLLFSVHPAAVAAQDGILVRAVRGEQPRAVIHAGAVDRLAPTLAGGTLFAASGGAAPGQTSAPARAGAPAGVGRTSLGCGNRNPAEFNVRVNQDCSFRLQGEELIKLDPADPTNLVAGMNDERQGFNYNAFAYSFDRGRTWGDDPPPYYQKINNPAAEEPTPADPNRHTVAGGAGNGFTYDGGSDPAVTVDLEGRAYYGNIIFDRAAGAGAAVVVTQSPQGAGGSFYDNLAPFTRNFVVAEDNTPTIFHDKLFVTADVGPSSPNRDNVYVTWTLFRADATGTTTLESPIFASMSTDHARTWSTPEEISGASPTLCFFGNAFDPTLDPHACNMDQGSDPVTLSNGDLAVAFNNVNSAAGNPNAQQLSVHCRPSGSSPAGTAHLNCGAPTRVGSDVVVGEPVCAGQGECIPGAFVRANDFPRIAVNRGNDHLYAAWQDFRNGEFDIELSQSTDGGATWTESAAPVNPDAGKDHFEPAIDVVCSGPMAAGNPSCPGGDDTNLPSPPRNNLCSAPTTSRVAAGNDAGGRDHVAVSYYRTCQVPNEAEPASCLGGAGTNCVVFAPGAQQGVQAEPSDYALAGGRGRTVPYRARSVSPVFQPPDGLQRGFMGDYTGIAVVGSVAHPIWSDQRVGIPAAFQADQGGTRDEDVYTASVRVPDGEDENQTT